MEKTQQSTFSYRYIYRFTFSVGMGNCPLSTPLLNFCIPKIKITLKSQRSTPFGYWVRKTRRIKPYLDKETFREVKNLIQWSTSYKQCYQRKTNERNEYI
jgi:hypothetical protein